MDSWQIFWAMGGYGTYVWSSYGLSLIVPAALWWIAHHRKMRTLRRLAQQQIA